MMNKAALHALCETIAPSGGAFPDHALSVDLASRVRESAAAGRKGRAVAAMLWLLELSPPVLRPRCLSLFSRLPLSDRIAVLEAWENSGLWPLRAGMQFLKLLVTGAFYSHPSVQRSLGYPAAPEQSTGEELP